MSPRTFLLLILLILDVNFKPYQWSGIEFLTKSTIVQDARTTEYDPSIEDPSTGGMNCVPPCDMTAFMTPIIYGVTAACGPDVPFNTSVLIRLQSGIHTRLCQDRGGAVDNNEVDVLAYIEGRPNIFYGYHTVVWKGWEDMSSVRTIPEELWEEAKECSGHVTLAKLLRHKTDYSLREAVHTAKHFWPMIKEMRETGVSIDP